MTNKLYKFKVAGTVMTTDYDNSDIETIRNWCECAIYKAINHAGANFNVHIDIELIGDDHEEEVIDDPKTT